MTDFFKFEENNLDIPFYNGEPFLSKSKWALLILSIIVFIGVLYVPIPIEQRLVSILLFLVTFIPFMYVCKGNLSLFFRKVRRKDIAVILLCLIGYYCYAFVVGQLLQLVGIVPQANGTLHSNMDLMFWVTTILQLLGEELFKIILILIVMCGLYNITNNRKLSLAVAVFVSLMIFGLIHYNAYGVLAQIILIIGLGSIFDVFAYLKTKNILVSYILHILTDAIPFFFVMIFGF